MEDPARKGQRAGREGVEGCVAGCEAVPRPPFVCPLASYSLCLRSCASLPATGHTCSSASSARGSRISFHARCQSAAVSVSSFRVNTPEAPCCLSLPSIWKISLMAGLRVASTTICRLTQTSPSWHLSWRSSGGSLSALTVDIARLRKEIGAALSGLSEKTAGVAAKG